MLYGGIELIVQEDEGLTGIEFLVVSIILMVLAFVLFIVLMVKEEKAKLKKKEIQKNAAKGKTKNDATML
jgi:preprotein translocase subunit YajC